MQYRIEAERLKLPVKYFGPNHVICRNMMTSKSYDDSLTRLTLTTLSVAVRVRAESSVHAKPVLHIMLTFLAIILTTASKELHSFALLRSE